MEAFVLRNKNIIGQMAKGEFAGHVSHEFRAEFERVLRKYSNQHVNWNCNCKSVEMAAKVILRNEN